MQPSTTVYINELGDGFFCLGKPLETTPSLKCLYELVETATVYEKSAGVLAVPPDLYASAYSEVKDLCDDCGLLMVGYDKAPHPNFVCFNMAICPKATVQ